MSDLLNQSPPWVRSVFEHTWAPMQAMASQIRPFPQSIWDWLLKSDGGYVAICAEDSRYEPGPVIVRHRRVQNVAYVSIEDLAQDNDRPLHVIGHLLDHYLGCDGDADGPWLSEGGGATFKWQEAGERLPRMFTLGYGVDEIARTEVREYFAQSLAFYCRNRERLNVADPQICKWFRSTLWNEAFWRDDAKRDMGNEG
ncbi:MAG TPA: hypothetical protein VLY63_09620 [Anaerolineae bacterium]|nr:hypothetical protein [Anaerolineae bacterium]